MVICLGRSLRSSRRSIEVGHQTIRLARSNTTASASSKPSGDISSVFPSLSGAVSPPLAPRFADLKKRLIHGHESQVQESWHRLLTALQREREEIKALGSTTVPEINFYHLSDVERRTKLRDALHKRGVAVIRGVVTPKEALDWKELVQRYTRTNPSTKGMLLRLLLFDYVVSLRFLNVLTLYRHWKILMFDDLSRPRLRIESFARYDNLRSSHH